MLRLLSHNPRFLEIIRRCISDEEAARVLASLLTRDDISLLEETCSHAIVTVCGNAPCLYEELGRIEGTVYAADAATEVLMRHGIRPNAVFTDLDGATNLFTQINSQGTIIVVARPWR
jgi:uncharacterized Rossmann fold enzyme